MHVHDITEILNGDVGNSFLTVTPSIVDKDITSTMFGKYFVNKIFCMVGIGHIIDLVMDVTTYFFTGTLQYILLATGDNDSGACSFQTFCGCETKAAAATGNNCNTA